jgi:hypothetical protein
MSNNRFVWEGLAELKEGLRRLPDELKGDASNRALGAANGAAVEIRRGYEQTAESLAQAVVVERDAPGPFAAGAKVVTRHKLAWLFENGTQVRHTAFGANRGAMRPQHVFVPPIMRARIRFYQELMDLLRRKGLLVTGG